MESSKRLVKSRTNRMIDGVCAGIADFFAIDVTLVRVAFVVFAFMGGLTVIAYITAMIVMPAESHQDRVQTPNLQSDQKRTIQSGFFWGVILILAGLIFLLEELHIFHFHWFSRMFNWNWILPILLIGIGITLILTRDRFEKVSDELMDAGNQGKFHRKSAGRKIWGVCGGIADHLHWDVSLVRVAWVVLTFLTFPLGIVAYVLIALVTPDESNQSVYKSANS